MASIKAKFSAIEKYKDQCVDEYRGIINLANDILDRTERLLIFVMGESEKISIQLIRAEMLCEQIEFKVKNYNGRSAEALRVADGYSQQIDYIYSHPMTITETDSEGNQSSRQVVDYDSIRVAERSRDEAHYTGNRYKEMAFDAQMVCTEAKSLFYDLSRKKQGIEQVSSDIQNYIYEIRKYINAIADEASFNVNSLQGVISSLRNYLASKAIFMPEGAHYEQFVSEKI